jgi:molybdopterin/thiamine biosynthesis adenylyltransferase
MNRHKNEAMELWMDRGQESTVQWEEPECYDLNLAGDSRQMYSRIVMGGAKVQRTVGAVAEDLFELEHPDQKNNIAAREKFVQPLLEQGDRFGKWHYFAWSNRLVQYADNEEHRQLLTFRNRELITADELLKLNLATTAHVGLSVGSHILTQTVHMGLGRRVVLADPDVVSVPNLNRIHVGMPEVGMRKTDVAGIMVSELNPYVKQIHLPEGITPQNVHIFEHYPPDLIFEEVDHMPTKILMRKIAQQVKAALIMAGDIGDRSMIDIERYDLGDTEPFLGKLTSEELVKLESGKLPADENLRLMIKHIGLENISHSFGVSIGQIGISLGGIAQLGTTASVGGAYAAVAGREILLNRGPASGRYKVSPQEILRTRYI